MKLNVKKNKCTLIRCLKFTLILNTIGLKYSQLIKITSYANEKEANKM